jgi:hypothetical protein
MDLGTRRRLRRERLRREHGTTRPEVVQDSAVSAVVVALVVTASIAGGVAHMPIATALHRLYCTPEDCAALPQVLTGLAIALTPPAVYLWRLDAAFYLGLLQAGFMGSLFITSNQDVPVEINPIVDLWVLPLTYFLMALVVVPMGLTIWRMARPGAPAHRQSEPPAPKSGSKWRK